MLQNYIPRSAPTQPPHLEETQPRPRTSKNGASKKIPTLKTSPTSNPKRYVFHLDDSIKEGKVGTSTMLSRVLWRSKASICSSKVALAFVCNLLAPCLLHVLSIKEQNWNSSLWKIFWSSIKHIVAHIVIWCLGNGLNYPKPGNLEARKHLAGSWLWLAGSMWTNVVRVEPCAVPTTAHTWRPEFLGRSAWRGVCWWRARSRVRPWSGWQRVRKMQRMWTGVSAC